MPPKRLFPLLIVVTQSAHRLKEIRAGELFWFGFTLRRRARPRLFLGAAAFHAAFWILMPMTLLLAPPRSQPTPRVAAFMWVLVAQLATLGLNALVQAVRWAWAGEVGPPNRLSGQESRLLFGIAVGGQVLMAGLMALCVSGMVGLLRPRFPG